MRAPVTKRAMAVVVAIGLAFGSVGATDAATSVPWVEPLEAGGRAFDEQTRVIELGVDGDGVPRAGYMCGRTFVGFVP